MKKTANLLYRSVGTVNLLADVYMPDVPGAYPAVLVIPGGGWCNTNKDDWGLVGQVSRFPAAGYVAMVVQHRLCPPGGTFTAPAPLEDLQAAVAWMKANATTYSIDPARIGAWGQSSGGHLALMLANEAPIVGLKAAASWSGPTHFPAMGLYWLAVGQLQNYIGSPYPANPNAWRDASPFYALSAATSPVFLAQSSQDPLVPYQQAVDYYDRCKQLDLRVEKLFTTDGSHASALDAAAWAPTLSFFGRYL